MRGLLTFAICTGLASGPVASAAQEVTPCDFRASAENIVEPWEENSRTFANGAVRVALLDTIEPGAAAFHILLLSPPFDDVGGRQCRMISPARGFGFYSVDFQALEAAYDPATGLSFALPVQAVDETGNPKPHRLHFTLNQASGAISAELAP
ncbi:MAG: hypothetical protein IE919_02595 [Thioclava sp.]|nr:hypothetical protein [Thioclava sp.]MBD3802109.1 hypothetical protein [Thioclava sp.]